MNVPTIIVEWYQGNHRNHGLNNEKNIAIAIIFFFIYLTVYQANFEIRFFLKN